MNESPNRIRLIIQGVGHIPSFKNKWKPGKRRIYLDPPTKEWMEKVAAHIASELYASCQTTGTVTPTVCFLRSWIATSLPLDDSLKWIGEGSVSWRKVTSGMEGFELHIEPWPENVPQ